MESQGFGIIFLTFLLLSAIVVSDVAAKPDTTSNGTINVDTYQLPALQFDKTQSKIIIDKELSPSVESAVSQKSRMTVAPETPATVTIPSGSIIHHSKDGVTTVFDSTGQQLFAADDTQAKMVPTPSGTLPATCVHEVPSGSILYKRDNITYVISNNNLILVEIKEKSGENDSVPNKTTPGKSAGYTTLGASTAGADNPLAHWIERVTFDTPDDMGSEYLKNYSAQWKVPNPPLTTTPNQVQYLAIEEEAFEVNNNGTVAFASVLEWNYYPNTWDITTWMHDYNVRITGYFSQREVVNTGDIISGNISSTNLYGFPPPYPIRVAWSVRSSDQSGHSSELSLNSSSLIESRGGGADTLLMLSGDTSLPSEDYLVGDTTFWSYIFTDNHDYPLNPPIRSTYINYALAGNPAFSNLRIETNNWPGKIVLGTSPPPKPTYSITCIENYDYSGNIPGSIEECDRFASRLDREGYQQVFYNKDGDVTAENFGAGDPFYTGHKLTESAFHYHSGHGSEEISLLGEWSTILLLKGYTHWTPFWNRVNAADVEKKWGDKNKWVMLDACGVLRDESWGRALTTSHGILGWTSYASTRTDFPDKFFEYAIDKKWTIKNAYKQATLDIEKTDNMTASIITKTKEQFDIDHFPGQGTMAPDGDPSSDDFYQRQWNCLRGEEW